MATESDRTDQRAGDENQTGSATGQAREQEIRIDQDGQPGQTSEQQLRIRQDRGTGQTRAHQPRIGHIDRQEKTDSTGSS